MNTDIERVLLREREITKRVKEIAEKINNDYKSSSEKPLFIVVLKGGYIFAADLLRLLNFDFKVDFIKASSYGSGAVSTGELNVSYVFSEDVRGKEVILVEDIVDTGFAISGIKKLVYEKGAKNVKVCSMLSKPSRVKVHVDIDYLGFTIEDEFVVGYGLDYNEKYRCLPYIGILKRSVYE